ncbi:MAG TPA: hypothetical protein VFA43_07280 [Gemmatimonadaceae bacterium]|nr:hypothetical protein [Gemmatimonadaceae bacterium]
MSPAIIGMPAGMGIGMDMDDADIPGIFAIPGMLAMLVSLGGVVCADASDAPTTIAMHATPDLNSRCP